MNIPFIDLQEQYQRNKNAIDSAIARVLEHGQYIMGPEVKELEKTLADYIGVKHVLACSSGTDALVLPLMAKGLGEQDAIFTSPFTFFASAESISLAGATPVFVDIDPDTYNICPKSLVTSIEKVKSDELLDPKGIMPIDLFGLAADYDSINSVAEKFHLFVIEDAAQSFGAGYKGSKACGLGDVGATSFYPAKPLGCYGDGGAVFTNDSRLYEEMLSLRVHGQGNSGDKYDNIRIGLNARMDTIQAAILLEKFKLYQNEIRLRNEVADKYNERLNGIVKIPTTPVGLTSVWAQYSIQTENRDDVREELNKHGIPTAVFYPTPIHLSSAYEHLGYSLGDFPVAESISNRILSLPMHPFLQENQIDEIADIIKSVI